MSSGAGDRPHDGVRDLVFNVRVGGRAPRGRRIERVGDRGGDR